MECDGVVVVLWFAKGEFRLVIDSKAVITHLIEVPVSILVLEVLVGQST